MAPRAKTNRERILEEQALLPKIEEMLAPREIEVRADGSEYLGGRQLAPKPEVTRFAGGIGIEQNDDGQWVQRPNYPAAGSGPWGGVLGQRHRVIQRLIDPNNKAFRGDNEIIDPGDLVVNPVRLLNVFDGTHRDVAKAAALGITIDELRSAQKVANEKKVRESRFVRRDSLGNVIDDPSSQITSPSVPKIKGVAILTDATQKLAFRKISNQAKLVSILTPANPKTYQQNRN